MNRSAEKTRILTETAAAVALASVLVMLKLIFPFLVFITMIAAASPIAVIGCFHGLRWSLAASAATMLVVTMTGGPEIGLTTAVYAAALGTTLGEGYRRKWTYSKKIWTTALAYVAEMSYKIIFSIYVLGIADALSAGLDRMIRLVEWIWQPLARAAGVDPDPGRAVFSWAGAALVGILFLMNAGAYAYLNTELCGALIQRLKGVRRA
jgi:hypothetical protein